MAKFVSPYVARTSEKAGLASSGYGFFFWRTGGDWAKVKITISSPVAVLMSWCRLTTSTPVTFRTVDSNTGRAASINWILTCLSKFLPLSVGCDWTRCCSAAVRTPCKRIKTRSPIKRQLIPEGPRPMNSCSNRPMPSHNAASISPGCFSS